MKKKYFVIGIIILLFALINEVPLNIRYTFQLFIISAFVMYIYVDKRLQNKVITYDDPKKIIKKFNKVAVIAFIIVFLSVFASSPVIFASKYYKLLGETKEADFTKEYEEISVEELPIVDLAYAKQLGDKKIGEVKGLGSEFEVGNYTDIVVNGRQALVAPLEYRGVIKWLNNRKTGVPGYIYIDKITGEVSYVNEIEGAKIGMKYVNSAYLFDNLDRRAYLFGSMFSVLEKPFFELDDEMNPYFIIPKLKPQIFINGGLDVFEIIVIDAQTGEDKTYGVDDAPEWIDNVFPAELITEQINYWGRYENGFFNSILGQKNLVETTKGTRHVLQQEDLNIYTGLTSLGADESTVGFMFVDVSTKEATYFAESGATETAAMSSAEGKVQNLGYYATFPIPTLIANQPTFFITLKDQKGLIKMYSFVNINDYTKVAVGETPTEARNEYIKLFSKDVGEVETERIENAVVERIGYYTLDETTIYFIKFVNDENIYEVELAVSSELVLTKAGDSINFSHLATIITDFDNSEF